MSQIKSESEELAEYYNGKKVALEKIITDFRTEMAALQAKQDGSVQQLADKQIRIEELNKQNKQTQANLEHYRAASLEQRQLESEKTSAKRKKLDYP